MRLLTLASVAALSSLAPSMACGPAPVFDSDIGVAAEPIEKGAAEGTFALKVVNTTLVHVPVLGDFAGGGTNYRLVHRTYDADSDTYEQRSNLCGGFNVEVSGVLTDLPESTYRAVAESVAEKVVIDDAGVYDQTDHLQLWGLRDLDDPFTSPLPKTKEEAAESPHKDHIFDMDDDDNPGVTSVVSGAVSGEVFVIQRKTVTTHGITLGPDRNIGLAKNTNEVLQLGNTNPLLDRQSEGSSEPHPDPKRSWFEEVRVDDDTDCDVVMGLEDEGVLSKFAPFPTAEDDAE